MRDGSPDAQAGLVRPGRYQTVRDNLRVKDVRLGEGDAAKRWLLGTRQGGVAEQHLDAYLDEFVFRFNRRKSRRRGLLFYRPMCLAVSAPPTTYERIVWSRRGQ